jgi:predicted metal-dependent peptidase
MPTMNQIKLTPEQKKLWDDTRVALMWKCPMFTHILFTMLDKVNGETIALFTDEVPIAATDGSSLIINPETFFKFNLYERVFICAHEILHCIFNHCVLAHGFQTRGKVAYPDGKTLPYDHKTMNVAMDLVINAILVEAGTGQMPKEGCLDQALVTGKDSFLDSYRKIFPDMQKGKGPSGGGFDQHLAPGKSQGKDPHQASQERNEAAWGTAIAQGLASAKAQGKMPAGLERLLRECLQPQVDWREHIQALFARKLGGGGYDWLKPDRRFMARDIFVPARSGHGAECVVVGVDTSGSIGQRELDVFMGEVAGILEDVRPRDLFIVWCDARVNRVDHVDDPGELRHLKMPGGGGTDFRPVFDWVTQQNLQPDCLVYLTDGLGPFPNKPAAFPVVWGNISKPGSVRYPFGDVVDVPPQVA